MSPDDTALIDRSLLDHAAPQWRKVARVVGSTMLGLKPKFDGVPDAYYSRRIIKLVNDGLLDAQGDLREMRFSEVRLPVK